MTVNENGLQLNTTDTAVISVVDRQFVENMPLNGRSFQSLLTLVPGVTVVPVVTNGGSGYSSEITVNGQRSEGNYFMVDGVSANTGAAAGVPRHYLHLYSAQYGGGQFEFLTRSGTDRLHGNVFDYLRNDAFDANSSLNKFSKIAKLRERQNDFGGAVYFALSLICFPGPSSPSVRREA